MGVEYVDDALPQTCVKAPAIQGSGAVGLGLGIAIVDEHQIQIRTVPQLDATDLAIADDDEVQLTGRAIVALGHAMRRTMSCQASCSNCCKMASAIQVR